MNSNSYFARLYFPEFYFNIKGATGIRNITAQLSGNGTVTATLTDANYIPVATLPGGGWTRIPIRYEEVVVRRAALSAQLGSVSNVTGTLTATLALSAVIASPASLVQADLTGNPEAKVRYRRRKEQEAVAFMLLAA